MGSQRKVFWLNIFDVFIRGGQRTAKGRRGAPRSCGRDAAQAGVPAGFEGEKETIFGVDAEQHAAGVGKKS